jgi:hypothetical protein
MLNPDAKRPRESEGGDSRKYFVYNPPRAIPALKRNLIECRFDPLHPSP